MCLALQRAAAAAMAAQAGGISGRAVGQRMHRCATPRPPSLVASGAVSMRQMHTLAAHRRGRSASHQPLRGLAQIDNAIDHARVRCIAAASHTAATATAPHGDTAWRPQDEATIVTAGWLGARERPFSKYTDLWHNALGFARVVPCRPPAAAVMFPPLGLRLASALARQLAADAAARPGAPVLIHLFSGGGFIFVGWTFALLARAAARGDAGASAALAAVRGVVLDSAPATVDGDVSARALVAAALGEPAEGVEARWPRAVAALRAVVDVYLSLPPIAARLADVEAAWHRDAPAHAALLCLHSDGDALVPPRVVADFMRRQEARGSAVEGKLFEGSGHVSHLKEHPEAYTAALAAFAEHVLAPPAPPSEEQQGSRDDSGGTAAAGEAARAA